MCFFTQGLILPSPTQDISEHLIGDAYDLASVGLGVQQAIVKHLMGDKVAHQSIVDSQYDVGTGSNIFVTMGRSSDWFGLPCKDLIDRYAELNNRAKEFDFIVIKAVLMGSSFNECIDVDLDKEKFIKLINEFF